MDSGAAMLGTAMHLWEEQETPLYSDETVSSGELGERETPAGEHSVRGRGGGGMCPFTEERGGRDKHTSARETNINLSYKRSAIRMTQTAWQNLGKSQELAVVPLVLWGFDSRTTQKLSVFEKVKWLN